MAAPLPKQPELAIGEDNAVLLFVALAFVVYAPALAAGFIWDDGRAITDNLALRSWHGLRDIWSGQGDADYFPLKSTVLWLVYQVFGARTSPYHILNVGAHAANAVLLWRVLRRLSIPGAWLAGLVFLVHPTHVESVAWVSECKNTLSLLFALLAVPLAARPKGGARARGFLYSAGIVGAYYYLGRAVELAARRNSFDPMLAAWLPNLIGLVALVILLVRLPRSAA